MERERGDLVLNAVNQGKFPRILYKYRGFDSNTDSIITTSSFWFAQHHTFNDPFDCNLSETRNHSIKDFREYLEYLNRTQSVIDDQIKIAKKDKSYIRSMATKARKVAMEKRGILSLSSIQDNILMWSHYAASHTGMVIALDMLEDTEFFSIPLNVKYQDTYTELNYYKNREETVTKNLITKSSLWTYEKEVRVIKSTYGLHKINKQAIKKIYFGCKSKAEDVRRFIKLVKSERFGKVKFYKANVSHGSFKLVFTEIK